MERHMVYNLLFHACLCSRDRLRVLLLLFHFGVALLCEQVRCVERCLSTMRVVFERDASHGLFRFRLVARLSSCSGFFSSPVFMKPWVCVFIAVVIWCLRLSIFSPPTCVPLATSTVVLAFAWPFLMLFCRMQGLPVTRFSLLVFSHFPLPGTTTASNPTTPAPDPNHSSNQNPASSSPPPFSSSSMLSLPVTPSTTALSAASSSSSSSLLFSSSSSSDLFEWPTYPFLDPERTDFDAECLLTPSYSHSASSSSSSSPSSSSSCSSWLSHSVSSSASRSCSLWNENNDSNAATITTCC